MADLVLFNLMGLFGTSKAALWIVPSGNHQAPILLRSQGIPHNWAKAVGTVCACLVDDDNFAEAGPLLVSDLGESLGASHKRLLQDAGIALFVSVSARDKLLSIIGLGCRIGGEAYTKTDLHVLHSCMGMIGVALENTNLYKNLLEKHRLLRQANENQRELDHLKSEFVRNVNHELRTPLTIVLAYTEALVNMEIDADRHREFLEIILRESRKLMVMLEKLLNFSAVSENRLEYQFQEGDLRPVLERFYSERVPGVAESYREFSFAADGDAPSARFDPQRLWEILDVILDNALKFTPPGSRICVWLKCHRDGNRRMAKIEIEDDGPGIPQERLDTLFESFGQVDGSTRREVGGLGMGLAFAKKLSDRMGIKLSVASEVGRGSVFTLVIPAAEESDRAA